MDRTCFLIPCASSRFAPLSANNASMERSGFQLSIAALLGLVACVALNIWLFRLGVLWGILGLNVTKHVAIAYLCQVLGVDRPVPPSAGWSSVRPLSTTTRSLSRRGGESPSFEATDGPDASNSCESWVRLGNERSVARFCPSDRLGNAAKSDGRSCRDRVTSPAPMS